MCQAETTIWRWIGEGRHKNDGLWAASESNWDRGTPEAPPTSGTLAGTGEWACGWHRQLICAPHIPPRDTPPGLPTHPLHQLQLASPLTQGLGGAGAGSHGGQGWLPQQVRPVFLASGRAIHGHRPGNGVMAPSPKGWPTAGTGLTPGLVKRSKPGLGLECRT